MVTFCHEAQDVKAFLPPTLLSPVTATQAFQLAIDAAREGLGFVSPNPMVGAVAVDSQHRFLGYGAHLRYGEAHAEINLLAQLKAQNLVPQLKGATIYVTLEPCAHQGKTGSCAEALKGYGIAKVIYGSIDPNSQVNGKGIAVLEKAGIICEQFLEGSQVSANLLEIFAWNRTRESTFVGLKAAVSLDGSLAFHGDQNRAITKARAKTYGHYLRLKYDGIAIGQRTLILDNPALSARHPSLRNRNPKCVIVDPDLHGLAARPLSDFRLFANGGANVLWIIDEKHCEDSKLSALKNLGVQIVPLKCDYNHHIAAGDILAACYRHGIYSLLLEGGSGLYEGFLQAGLVNRLHLFQSPQLFTGTNRLPWYSDKSAQSIRGLSDITITALEGDWIVEGRF